MSTIILNKNRIEYLLKYKVPIAFLKGIEQDYINEITGVTTPKTFYTYSNSILKTKKIDGCFNIVPLCENINGDVYYLLFFNKKRISLVKYNLELGIVKKYALGFYEFLADILINTYENCDTIPVIKLTAIGEKLGADFSSKLFNLLEQATLNKERITFESDAHWRKKNIPKIINNNYEES